MQIREIRNILQSRGRLMASVCRQTFMVRASSKGYCPNIHMRGFIVLTLALMLMLPMASFAQAPRPPELPPFPTFDPNQPRPEIKPPTPEELAAMAAQRKIEEDGRRLHEAETLRWVHKPVGGESLGTTTALAAKQRQDALAFQERLKIRKMAEEKDLEEFLAKYNLPRVMTNGQGGTTRAVGFADGQPRYLKGLTLSQAAQIQTTNLWPGGLSGLNLTGTNTHIGLWEVDDVYTNHAEFTTNGLRIQKLDAPGSFYNLDVDHATAVAGALMAAGVDGNSKGMSYQAKLYAFQASDYILEMGDMAATNHLYLSNHSYQTRAAWVKFGSDWFWFGNILISGDQDYKFGFYGPEAADLDSLAYYHPRYLSVWAAGNERADPGLPAPQPFPHYTFSGSSLVYVTSMSHRGTNSDSSGYDSLPPQQTAKNTLVVGSVNSYGGVSDFSSLGPTDDGRIKPDLAAPGESVYSPSYLFGYSSPSGTSMAAPRVKARSVADQSSRW